MGFELEFKDRVAHFVTLLRFEYLVGLFLGLNLIDCLVTFRALSLGGSEINPLVLIMGGPFAPLPLFLKLVFFPGLAVALIPLFYRCENKGLLHGMLIVSVAYYVFVVAENLWTVLKMSNACPV